MTQEKSSHCCQAPPKNVSGDEGTGYTVCKACGKEFLTNDKPKKFTVTDNSRWWDNGIGEYFGYEIAAIIAEAIHRDRIRLAVKVENLRATKDARKEKTGLGIWNAAIDKVLDIIRDKKSPEV